MTMYVYILYLCLSPVMSARPVIYIAGLLPMTYKNVTDQRFAVGKDVYPALELALEHINQDPAILPKHSLDLVWNDTQCDLAWGTKIFFDLMHSKPDKSILLGDGCLHVTTTIAQASPYWNIWQVSFSDTYPLLSDRTIYPNFYRTVPSDGDSCHTVVALLNEFNWTFVGTLFQDASKESSRYSYAHDLLINILDHRNITRISKGFASDPSTAIRDLKNANVRIIVGFFDEQMARTIFCHAIIEGLVGARYAWILTSNYSEHWWVHDDVTCDAYDLELAVEGYFHIDIPEISHGKTTQGRRTPEQYLTAYRDRHPDYKTKFHGYAYDAMWTIAQALNRHLGGDTIANALNKTDFQGVTGLVRFSKGDRIGEMIIQQVQTGQWTVVRKYDHNTRKLSKVFPIAWTGAGAPLDKPVIERPQYHINPTLYLLMCVLAGLGILLTIVFLSINIRHRNHRYIKMSSPNLNNVIIVGCILAYISIILQGYDYVPSSMYTTMCFSRLWVISLAFTLAYGAIFSKTWRVHAIFTNIKMKKMIIKDCQLLTVVLVLVLVDFVVLITWVFLNPFRDESRNLPAQMTDGDTEIIPVIVRCVSNHMTVWLGIIYSYKGLLLIFGCFLAWQTRHVSIPALNDSQYIGFCVYNLVIICSAGVIISAIVHDEPDTAFLVTSLSILICTTITLCLVFVPKIIELRKDPLGVKKLRDKVKEAALPRHEISQELHSKIEDISKELRENKQKLSQKNEQIVKLRKDLLALCEDDGEAEKLQACLKTDNYGTI